MPEYIEKDRVLKEINNCMRYDGSRVRKEYPLLLLGESEINCRIMRIPAADVVPVVRGRWMLFQNNLTYYCSRCGRRCNTKEPYCHCGARMDEMEETV